MWFCARGDAYRIYYAHFEGRSGLAAQDRAGPRHLRKAAGTTEMVEYPFVFDHAGSRYMLYAGNGFGRTGFGLAVLES